MASVTYRVPVARWDDALTALRKLGSKTLSEQTDTSDVTSQVIDLDARLDKPEDHRKRAAGDHGSSHRPSRT